MSGTTEKLPVGTRIRFVKTLECGPTGDHPALLFASKGEYGTITDHNDWEGYMVKRDAWPTAFGAKHREEFEVAQ